MNKKYMSGFRKLMLFLSFLSLGILSALLWFQIANKSSSAEEEALKAELNEFKYALSIYESLITLDGHTLSTDNFDDISEKYNELFREIDSLGVLREEWINNRLSYIENSNMSVDEQNLAINQLKQQVRFLRLKRDSIHTDYNEVANQLNHSKIRLDKLQDSIDILLFENKRIKDRKDKIRVITFTIKSGKKIHYLGEVENEMANGNGVGIWNNGNIYRGEWKNNMRHGEGTYEWFEGDKYVGEFVSGDIEGESIYYWKSGERYEGKFKSNRRNGQGTLFDPDGNVKFKGLWKDDTTVICLKLINTHYELYR
ncbi:MAG: hypothetical protein JJU02_12235 [Cryomorphaceae bacterium]|nr:hypothetical protein [Cryomorphaceae bacterium]